MRFYLARLQSSGLKDRRKKHVGEEDQPMVSVGLELPLELVEKVKDKVIDADGNVKEKQLPPHA